MDKKQSFESFFKSEFNLIVSLNKLESIKKLVQVFSKGASLFEIRVDLLSSNQLNQLESWLSQAQAHNLPILLTIRHQNEGGQFIGKEDERLAQIKKIALSEAVMAIDIEQRCVIYNDIIDFAKHHHKLTISSVHFFDSCPNINQMHTLLDNFKSSNSDIFKLAVNLENFAEYQQLSQFLLGQSKDNSLNKKIIIVGMGKFSILSRLSFPALGSIASYCYISKQTAPNQPSFKELIQLKSVCY